MYVYMYICMYMHSGSTRVGPSGLMHTFIINGQSEYWTDRLYTKNILFIVALNDWILLLLSFLCHTNLSWWRFQWILFIYYLLHIISRVHIWLFLIEICFSFNTVLGHVSHFNRCANFRHFITLCWEKSSFSWTWIAFTGCVTNSRAIFLVPSLDLCLATGTLAPLRAPLVDR